MLQDPNPAGAAGRSSGVCCCSLLGTAAATGAGAAAPGPLATDSMHLYQVPSQCLTCRCSKHASERCDLKLYGTAGVGTTHRPRHRASLLGNKTDAPCLAVLLASLRDPLSVLPGIPSAPKLRSVCEACTLGGAWLHVAWYMQRPCVCVSYVASAVTRVAATCVTILPCGLAAAQPRWASRGRALADDLVSCMSAGSAH